MKYSPADIQQLTGKKRETIRKWSQDFAKWLTPGARPATGGHRVYEDSDLKVFMFIKSMADRNISLDEIALVLGQPETFDKIQAATPEVSTALAISPQEQINELTITIAELQSENDSLGGQNRLLKQQLAATQDRLEKLLIENALLKAKRSE